MFRCLMEGFGEKFFRERRVTSFGIETYRGYRGRRKSKERHDAHRSPLVARPAANSIPYADTIYLKQRKKSISPLITLSYIQPRIKQNYPLDRFFSFFPFLLLLLFFSSILSPTYARENKHAVAWSARPAVGVYTESDLHRVNVNDIRNESNHLREWFNEMHKYFCTSGRKKEIVCASERASEIERERGEFSVEGE